MKKYGYIKNIKNQIKKKNKIKSNNNIINNRSKKGTRKKRQNLVQNLISRGSAPPPKDKSKTNNKTNNKANNKNNKKKEEYVIKNLKIINNNSSVNYIKSSNKELFSNTNKKKLGKKSKKQKKANIQNLETQIIPKKDKNKKNENKKNKNLNNFALINMDINISRGGEYIPPESHIFLNNYNFKEALKYDYRQLCEIFYIFALAKQILFHTFLFWSPLELFPLRLCLLFFIISSDLALNALFYFNNNISKKYRSAKNIFIFAFSDNITIIFLSIFVGFILLTLLSKLSNSTNNIREVFKKEEEKMKKNKKYKITEKRKKEILLEIEEILKNYKIKVVVLIVIELIIFLFFWYFVTAFCHVYISTQKSWLFDSFISISCQAIIELIISLGLAKLYRLSINSKFHCLYKIAMFMYNFG
jgi:hypothetical protein